jgi:hypothetical protein
VDVEDLALHEGAPVLLRLALAEMNPGEWLEVHGDSPQLGEQLAAWCHKEGHGYECPQGITNVYRIQHRDLAPSIVTSRTEISEIAEPKWGLAPRGATIEEAGPEFHFSLRTKREVWARELDVIYRQATANQWTVSRDIPWNELPRLAPELEVAIGQIMTFLTENEFAALYIPARFIPRIHPHYREVVEVLAMQVADEARHAEAFTKRAEAGSGRLGTTAASGQLSLKTLLEEPDFTTATFLLCVMGEGTFLTLLKFLGDHAPDPVTAALVRLAHRDEARHVAFGIEHMRYVFEREPEQRLSMEMATERRSSMLASVSGLSSYVHDALVIVAGGGTTVAQIREGARHVANLHREMDRARRERLQSLGFGAADAARMSEYHTKNFM